MGDSESGFETHRHETCDHETRKLKTHDYETHTGVKITDMKITDMKRTGMKIMGMKIKRYTKSGHTKRVRKAWVVLTAIVASLALVAAACGGDDDDSTPDDSATTQITTTTTPSSSSDNGGGSGGEDGSDTGSGSSNDGGEGTDTTDDGEGDGGSASGGSSECDIEPYQDPRGGIFQDYQNQINRCHPFQPLDAFCMPHDVPAVERVATDPGITADSITLVHLRTRLEELAGLGFATPIGDPTLMFNTFAWYVNNVCGGVNGRMIDMQLVEVPASGSDVDAQRNAGCIEATEDRNAVIIMNSTGFQGSANLCIVEEHETMFISTQAQTEEYVNRGEGRLIMTSPTLEEAVRIATNVLLDSGELEGKTIGAIAPDTPGQPEAVLNGLVNPLREAGYDVPVFDVIGCGGTVVCAEGASESVINLIENDVEVVFVNMNIISNPQYIAEMARQGIEPGDIQFIGSNFNSMSSDLVSSKVVEFGQEPAGNLYNGTQMIVTNDPAAFLYRDNYPVEFNKMCSTTLDENFQNAEGDENLLDPPYDPFTRADDGASAYGMVINVCQQMRIAMRAIYDAGPNPTRQDIYEAMLNLGAMDSSSMLPYSITPDKTQAPDAYHRVIFTYPCEAGEEFATEEGTCLVNAPNDEWQLIPR